MATPPAFSAGAVLTAAQMNAVGLWLVTPTSVAGTGVSLSGATVSYSAATTVSVNGCFTTDFKQYRIVGRHVPTGALARSNIRFRNAGTDQTGANYQSTSARLYTNVAIDVVASGATTLDLSNGGIANNSFGFTFDIFDPKGNTPTILTFDASNFEAASAAVRWWSTGGYTANYSHDGFTMYPNSGNWTGELRIYGYRD